MDDLDSDQSIDLLLEKINDTLGSKDDVETIENTSISSDKVGLFDRSEVLDFDFIDEFIPQQTIEPPPITDTHNTKWMEVIWPILKESKPSKDFPVLLEIVPKVKKRCFKFYWSDGKVRAGYISYKNFRKDEWSVTVNCDHFKARL